jgi:carboxyl-terminal processing protease
MKKLKKPHLKFATLFSGIILIIILLSYSFCIRENKDQILIQLVTQALDMTHFSPMDIDDDFSAKVFDQYLKRIDYNKRFFTKEDLKKLEAYKTKIDDEIKSRSIEFYTVANDMFTKNIDKIQKYYTEILAKPFEFNGNEVIETNPDKIDFPQNDAELYKSWQKILKYQVLVRVSNALDEQNQNITATTNKKKTLAPTGDDATPAVLEEPDGTEQSIADTSTKKKTFTELEADARSKVLKTHNDWFKRLKQMSATDRFALYLNAITGIYDPHTQYLPPQDEENFNITMSGQLQGIGAQLRQNSDGYTEIVDIVPGSPSWLQGELKPKDLILKVKQENQQAVDIYNMPIDDVVQLIRGKKGTKVTLTVKKSDGTIKNITLTRDVVILEETYAKSAIIEDQGSKIGYLYLPKFYANFEQTETGRTSSEDVANEIEKLKLENVKGIILDLRNNGGGSLNDAVQMAGLFIASGPVVQVKTKVGIPKILEDQDTTVQYRGPLVILVNSFSASASEILAAAMQDYKRAVIMGTTTFGKGTVQTKMDLDRFWNGSPNIGSLGSLLITIQKFYRINGGSTQLKGVTPDVILPDQYSAIETGERDQEYHMPWTQIKPVNYKVWPGLSKLNPIVQKENTDVASSPDFKIIKEEANLLKQQRDETIEPLNLDKYRKQEKAINEENKRLEASAKKDYGLKIRSLAVDVKSMNGDTAKIARSNNWIKELLKDIDLKEAINTIDLINEIK